MIKLKRICLTRDAGKKSDKEGTLVLLKTEDGYKVNNYIIEDPKRCKREYLEKVYNRVIGEPLLIKKTGRITLKELSEKDLPALYEIHKQESVKRFSEKPLEEYEIFEDKMMNYISSYEFFDCGLWGVFENKTGRLIGECGVHFTELESGKPELGFLLDEAYVGKGLAYEAAKASVKYAFKELDADSVSARTAKDNQRAQNLLKRLKFKQIKELKGAYEGFILYRLNRRRILPWRSKKNT